MNIRFHNARHAGIAAVLLALCITMPGIATARQISRQGRNATPLQQCAREDAADHASLTAWFSCMRGRVNPPSPYETSAAAEYWTRRRECRNKYNAMLQAHRNYQACEKRLKTAGHER